MYQILAVRAIIYCLFLANLVNGRKTKEDYFKHYDPDSRNMLPVIYQSGYLTIKDFDELSRHYTLDFPNREVQEGFLEILLGKFVTVPDDDLGITIDNLRGALETHNVDKALSIIQSAIADLPTIVKKNMCYCILSTLKAHQASFLKSPFRSL